MILSLLAFGNVGFAQKKNVKSKQQNVGKTPTTTKSVEAKNAVDELKKNPNQKKEKNVVYNADFEKGEELFALNKPDEAIAYFEKSLSEPDVDPKVYVYLGVCYYQIEQYEKSLDICVQGLSKEGTDKKILAYNAGNAAFALGNYAKANENYVLALREDGNYSAAVLNRANALLRLDRYFDARENYIKYLELEPENPQRENIEIIIRLLGEELDRIVKEQPERVNGEIAVKNENSVSSDSELAKAEHEKVIAELPVVISASDAAPEELVREDAFPPEIPSEQLQSARGDSVSQRSSVSQRDAISPEDYVPPALSRGQANQAQGSRSDAISPEDSIAPNLPAAGRNQKSSGERVTGDGLALAENENSNGNEAYRLSDGSPVLNQSGRTGTQSMNGGAGSDGKNSQGGTGSNPQSEKVTQNEISYENGKDSQSGSSSNQGEKVSQSELPSQSGNQSSQNLSQNQKNKSEKVSNRELEIPSRADSMISQNEAENSELVMDSEYQKRFEEESRLALEAEKARLAEESKKELEAEKSRLAEEARKNAESEAARIAAEEAEKRRSEEMRLALEVEKARLAEEARIALEAEKARLAEEARKSLELEKARLEAEDAKRALEAERARLAEEAKRNAEAEAARIASQEEARKRAEEEQKKALEAEKARLAEESRKALEAEQARIAKEEAEKRKNEEIKAAIEAEKARLAAENQKALEEERAKMEAEKAKIEEERRKAEIAEQERKFEEEKRRAIEEERAKIAEERKKMEEAEKARAIEEEKRKAVEEERSKLAEERKKMEEAEKARIIEEEKRKAVEAERAKIAEEQKKAEEEKRALEEEKARLAEEAKKAAEAEEARRAEEKAKEEARLAEEKAKEEARQKEIASWPKPEASVTVQGGENFTPDGDGHNDRVTLRPKIEHLEQAPENWVISILDPQGHPFRTISGKGDLPSQLEWDGTSDTGEVVVSKNTYTVTLSVTPSEKDRERIGAKTVTTSEKVNTGLLLEVIVPGHEWKMVVNSINFVPNGALDDKKLTSEQKSSNYETLDEIAAQIKDHPGAKIVIIEGYANNISGTEKEDREELLPLSQMRADAIVEELVKRGVSRDLLNATGKGGANPLASQEDHANWWKNRRVEFRIKQ